MQFQSACPLRGTTIEELYDREKEDISIRVPLAGHDPATRRGRLNTCYFNPRAPCGARPIRSRLQLSSKLFQSACPLRGTTGGDLGQQMTDRISIRVPLAGHDCAALR